MCRPRPERRSTSSPPRLRRRHGNSWRAGCTMSERDKRVVASVDHASDAKVLIISVAARLAGMHPQTLRQYDRLGLVSPARTPGGGRRYSERDVVLLREIQRLSQDDGVSLEGVRRIIDLEKLVVDL